MLAGIVLKVTLTQTKLSGKNEKKKKKKCQLVVVFTLHLKSYKSCDARYIEDSFKWSFISKH